MQARSENGNEPGVRNGAVHVAFVLDKSGSMQAVEEAVVEGYNDYLRELRGQGSETLFSLTTFDTRFEHLCVGELLANVAELDNRSYRPGGRTALFDAIGHTVLQTDDRLQAEGRDGEKVLVVVMTDGFENASTDYDAHTIAELVRRYDERPNWTFVYLGAGHETIRATQAAARAMSFKAGNAMRWEADPDSTRKSMKSLAHATGVRRDAATLKSERFFADADQSEADYERPEPAKPEPPRKPSPPQTSRTIHRRTLGDVLSTSRKAAGKRGSRS
jgi:von Willebrand factor type A domain